MQPVSRPVHLNRVLRAHGLLALRVERGLELLDAGASEAFAVADHQVAHVYVKDSARIAEVRAILEGVPGVERVLGEEELIGAGLAHPRSGDLFAVAAPESWFTYYYWEDDARAPDFARLVDIHKKPGYDPVELFTDPSDRLVMPRILWKLLKKKLGFRTLMDVIPLRAELVKGSHGRLPEDRQDYPIFISDNPALESGGVLEATEVCGELISVLKGR